MKFQLDIFDQIIESKRIWKTLEKESILTPFQSFSWLSNWYNTIGKSMNGLTPKIVVVKDESGPILLFPFGLQQKLNINILVWLGGSQVDYTAPIIHKRFYNNDYSINIIWENILAMIKGIDHILFNNQIMNINGFPNPLFEILNHHQSGISTQSLLTSSWDQYYQLMAGSKTRQTDRRKYRKLSKIDDVKFVIAEDSLTKKTIIDTMIKQKISRYKQTNVWNLFSEDEFVKFYKEQITNQENKIYRTHFSGLLVGGNFIATHFGIIADKTFYYLMPGQDTTNFSKYSPGRLLLLELFQWAFSNNIEVFDFTGGNEPYKKHWSNQNIPIYQMANQYTLVGRIHSLSSKFLLKIKKMKILQGRIKYIFFSVKNIINNFRSKR